MESKPILTEAFADNGEFSHWRLIDPQEGVLLWSGFPEEDELLYTGYKNPEKQSILLEAAKEEIEGLKEIFNDLTMSNIEISEKLAARNIEIENLKEKYSDIISSNIGLSQKEEIERLRKENEWVSVKDRLPEGFWTKHHPHLSEDVLIWNDLSILIGRYNRTMGWWETDEPAAENWVDDVTEWKPLPKQPTE